MRSKSAQIDLIKLLFYILKRSWIIAFCAIIGFLGFYWRTAYRMPDTYTATGTMYVLNGNPNIINYQYTNTSDLNSALQLLDTYMVVVKSNKVLDAVVDRLAPDYPYITAGYISSTLSMGSVSETGVLSVRCRTDEAQKSADICNAVLDVAPSEIIRVVNAGSIEIIDYATAPAFPDNRAPMRRGFRGALIGAGIAFVVLFVIFILNQRITSSKELTDAYIPPVLSSIKREKRESKDPGRFRLSDRSAMDVMESYAKLRMNLLYTLVGKKNQIVAVTSAISGEGKSTIAANLAISCANSGKKVLLIDADMRRACQRDIFSYSRKQAGLSNILIGATTWQEAIVDPGIENLSILASGRTPPNPAELLGSEAMRALLKELAGQFDLILLDTPPVNIVSDPLALSDEIAGCLFVVRQNFSDHREVRKALVSAELTGMDILGFAFYGEKVNQSSYYSRRYYKGYYHKYDTNRNRT